MASTSDPPAAGGGETSSVSAAAVAPPAEPPPPSSSSSKRRWSPCTWRYAIEEVQPELGSRPRNNNNNPPYSSSSLRTAGPDHTSFPTSSKSRPPHHTQGHASVKDCEEPTASRRSTYGIRTWSSTESSELRARHAQPHTQESLSKKKRLPPPQSHQQHQQKDPAQKTKEEEDEDEDEELGEDDEEDADHHSEDNKMRKRRELSPSELYYCDICRSKVAEAKANISVDSPLLSQDP